jgi:copper chaperone CopZ
MNGHRVFEVQEAGCASCAARVREALAPLATVHAIEIDAERDRATVRVDLQPDISESDINRVLDEASAGSGHSYRVEPGSWRLET